MALRSGRVDRRKSAGCGIWASLRDSGPPTLAACVNSADFGALDWPAAVARLRTLGLSKYNDFNLKNIAYERTDRHTLEARIFAASAPMPVVAAAALIEVVLRHCQRAIAIDPSPATPWDCEEMLAWLAELPLDGAARACWRDRAAQAQAPRRLDEVTQ